MKRLIVTLAAALAAMVIAAPVAAQTTGTIQTWLGTGFTMPTAVTLNSNREWEVQYEVTLDGNGGAIDNAIRQCEADPLSNDCEIKSPYIMRYGAIDVYSNCNGGEGGVTQPQINGINGRLNLNSWQQTLRARPSRDYCIALFSSKPGSFWNTYAFNVAGFRTPADPNPPAASPTGWGTGCFADPRGYAECNRLRTACNNDPSTTWEQSRNRCIPASN